MRRPILKKVAAALIAGFAIGSSGLCNASVTESADDLTRQAATLWNGGRLQAALDLENKAVKLAPNYWLGHSALSFLYWQHGQMDEAINEAQLATKLAPNNPLAILNLAQMEQLRGYYDRAVPLYRKAVKLAPNDWMPGIGLVQCLVLCARTPEALIVLNQMATQSNSNFDWWYQIAENYAKLNDSKSAQTAASKALTLAATAQQKCSSLSKLFIALLKCNEIERARALKDQVLAAKPKEKDVYLLAASSLYPVSAPEDAKLLLDCAIENATEADTFYKLSSIFETKAFDPNTESSKRVLWLNNAEAACRTAIKFNPGDPKYHLALAGVLDKEGKLDEMADSLNRAKTFDGNNTLALYLVSKIKARSNDLAGQLRGKLIGSSETAEQVNLTRVDFQLNNVHCACKLPALEYKLKRINGVAFVAIERGTKPYKGTMLLDQSFVTISQLIDLVKENEKEMTLQVLSSQQVKTPSEAIQIAQSFGDNQTVGLAWSFQAIAPKMPLN